MTEISSDAFHSNFIASKQHCHKPATNTFMPNF